MRPITVSVTTRNRRTAVERCLRSLHTIADLVDSVIVFDDASLPPIDVAALNSVAAESRLALEVIRVEQHQGTAAGKNRIAALARAPYLLSLDDDAFLVGGAAVRAALKVIQADAELAGVAFAQADEHGRRFPDAQQPASRSLPVYVPAFVGFACLLARDRLLAIGGYREAFVIHGEEREVCLRWLDRGWRVVYLPDATVAHLADPSNRDPRTYIRQVMRNDCLAAIYNEPLPRAVAVIPYKLWCFTRMRAQLPHGDPDGLRWLARELVSAAPAAWRLRRPVKWSTLREWRRVRDDVPLYVPSA